MASLRDYSVFGLCVRSEIILDELRPYGSEVEPDVMIRFGKIDAMGPPGYSHSEAGTLLTIPCIARYLIHGGTEIVIDPDPGAAERTVRLYLLGSAFGALLHQCGLMPLHANAIEIDGRAVAFCGHSGSGKSTIAAWFLDRGHHILADDVCVVGFDETGTALAYPGIPRLRLWREALEASGRAADGYERSFDALDKYDVPTTTHKPAEPLPLQGIYLLRRAPESAAEGSIVQLTGVDAVEALVANTYRGGYLKVIGQSGQHLMACVRIAKAVPVFRADRIWGFDAFESQATRLAKHAYRNGVDLSDLDI